MRPHVALVPYTMDWSYDLTARALQQHLDERLGRYDITILYRDDLTKLAGDEFDLVVDFWWRGRMHRKYPGRTAKQVSSHRWGRARWGSHDARTLTLTHLARNASVIVPSRRLEAELAPFIAGRLEHCPKGFHPETFGDAGDRRGDLVIGWAGNAKAADKNVAFLVEACPTLRIAGGDLPQSAMPAFYNSLDVITCASDAEGDPRPLIEGMACGCFPVTVDVGIAPELVRHGDNGLIVERSPQAFAEAFAWCRANVDQVREAGRRNAIEMLATRTWAQVSLAWGDAFHRAIERTR